jgi:hypothetical protein
MDVILEAHPTWRPLIRPGFVGAPRGEWCAFRRPNPVQYWVPRVNTFSVTSSRCAQAMSQ